MTRVTGAPKLQGGKAPEVMSKQLWHKCVGQKANLGQGNRTHDWWRAGSGHRGPECSERQSVEQETLAPQFPPHGHRKWAHTVLNRERPLAPDLSVFQRWSFNLKRPVQPVLSHKDVPLSHTLLLIFIVPPNHGASLMGPIRSHYLPEGIQKLKG